MIVLKNASILLTALRICTVYCNLIQADVCFFMHERYLSISVYKANNLVSHVKDVPPVKVRHVLVSILLRAIVQEVEDVLAS